VTDPDDRAFTGAFEDLRDLLRADGADLALESRVVGAVELRLVLLTAGCEDCVMPRPHLERVALDMFEHADAGVRTVTVIDPRDGSGALR
jgi:hypothetical protein